MQIIIAETVEPIPLDNRFNIENVGVPLTF